jgi:cation diffusion facilitator family transporter
MWRGTPIRPGQMLETANISTKLRLAALGSIVVAVAVFGLKFLAYWRTGSVALYSDALESIVNLVTAFAALYAVHVANQPADRQHQFGHHKAEYFSAVLEGVLIVIAALLIFHEAYDAVLAPRTLNQPMQGILINGVATVINAGWSYFLISWGRRQRSPALVADGWHLLTDVATSIGVLVGLVLVALTGWQILDPALAALVAANILWAGWKLMKESMSGLMDEAVTAEVARHIRQVISASGEGALQAHDIKTRIAGRVTFIEFHLVVPGKMTVAASHAICDRIEAALKEAVHGAQVQIHVEPEAEAKHAGIVPIG